MKLNDGYFDEVNMVCCAHCGEPQLHQDDIVVTDRGEDCDIGMQVRVHDEICTSAGDLTLYNPSRRRQGVAISLWCESCSSMENGTDRGLRTLLTIEQHKGITYIHVIKQPPHWPLSEKAAKQQLELIINNA